MADWLHLVLAIAAGVALGQIAAAFFWALLEQL
jgi:hypothetical protein